MNIQWHKNHVERFIIIISILLMLNACKQYSTGVVKENEYIQKVLFIKGKFFKFITAIQTGDFLPADGKEIAVFTPKEFFYFDTKGDLIQPVIYGESGFSKPEIIKQDSKIFIVLKGGGFSDVGLLDGNGRIVWKYKHHPGSGPEMAYGDIDRDGHLEFYVVEYDGLHALDERGKEIMEVRNNRLGI